MDTEEIMTWAQANLPELTLMIGGILSILIVAAYLKDKDSLTYKFMVFLGLVFGVFMAIEAVTNYGNWAMITTTIIAVAAFALIIRPFREVSFAVIIGIFVMVLIYIWLGGLTTVGSIDLTFLTENPVRIIVAFIVGGLVYGILNFGEAIVKLFGKILNWWPLLFLLGVVCIVESVMMYMEIGSIMDLINDL